MANYNKVALIGNVTRDPELKYTPKGTAIADIGLAVNRTFQPEGGEKQEETTFVDITFRGKQAETIGKYVQKGASLFVEGRLQMDTWEDKQTGQKRSKLKVIGEGFQFLGGKKTGDDQERPASRQVARTTSAPSGRNMDTFADNQEDGDDIPF